MLNILLVKRDADMEDAKNLKLPGSLIYDNEDVDDAAQRVLYELTGIKRMTLRQFRCFADPERASSEVDKKWLNKAYQPNIERLITVAYLSLCKINRKLTNVSKYKQTQWLPVTEIPPLPFDHNKIIKDALIEIRTWIDRDPAIIFELLPVKFTVSQLHKLYETVYNKKIDIRNFHKKVAAMTYVVSLDERQTNVSHRAARFYKFDRKLYRKQQTTMS
jgi:hypothetical protein